MVFIKWLLRIILGLAAFFGVAAAISVPLVPMTIFVVRWAGWTFSFLRNLPWWTAYVLALAGGLAITALVKSLPVVRNLRKFITEFVVFGAIFGGLFYVSQTYFFYYRIVPQDIIVKAYYLTKFGFIPTVFSSNVYTMFVSAGLVFIFLLVFALARALRNKKKLQAKLALSPARQARTTAPTNIVSSTDGSKIADYKAKKYVRDIWGNYIEEEDYNARINEVKNRRL